MCVCLSLCAWNVYLLLSVLFLCAWAHVSFFCLVTHGFHSSGVTCRSLCFMSKCLWMYETDQLCLAAYLHASLCLMHLSDQAPAFYLSVIYISLCLHLWVSLAAFECLWHSVSHSVCIFCVFSSVSLLAASQCISIVAVSEFVLDGMHISFCIFPLCISLSLSFCACGHGLFVSVCLSFAPIFVCITEWLSHCVHFSLSLGSGCLRESRQTREAPMIHTLFQTQSVSEKT